MLTKVIFLLTLDGCMQVIKSLQGVASSNDHLWTEQTIKSKCRNKCHSNKTPTAKREQRFVHNCENYRLSEGGRGPVSMLVGVCV